MRKLQKDPRGDQGHAQKEYPEIEGRKLNIHDLNDLIAALQYKCEQYPEIVTEKIRNAATDLLILIEDRACAFPDLQRREPVDLAPDQRYEISDVFNQVIANREEEAKKKG